MDVEIDVKKTLAELRENGFYAIKNFWPKEKCQEAISEINRAPRQLFEKGQGGDFRLQHSNKYIPSANEFLNDTSVQKIASAYSTCNRADRVVAGVLKHQEGQVTDSGGGWHVDSDRDFQFKSFIYLTDVNTHNGPFMIVKKSKKYANDVPKHSNFRIQEKNILNFCHPDDIIEILGTAGTLILADSTYIHRGKNINSGTRYSYTTYFYDREPKI